MYARLYLFQSGCGVSLIYVLHRGVVPLCCYPEMRRVCGLKGCFTARLRALQVPSCPTRSRLHFLIQIFAAAASGVEHGHGQYRGGRREL